MVDIEASVSETRWCILKHLLLFIWQKQRFCWSGVVRVELESWGVCDIFASVYINWRNTVNCVHKRKRHPNDVSINTEWDDAK